MLLPAWHRLLRRQLKQLFFAELVGDVLSRVFLVHFVESVQRRSLPKDGDAGAVPSQLGPALAHNLLICAFLKDASKLRFGRLRALGVSHTELAGVALSSVLYNDWHVVLGKINLSVSLHQTYLVHYFCFLPETLIANFQIHRRF